MTLTKEDHLCLAVERALADFLGLPNDQEFPSSQWTDIAREFAACAALTQVSKNNLWEMADTAKQLTIRLGKMVEAFGDVVE